MKSGSMSGYEQPFTRDVYGVRIPSDVETVVIRAHQAKGYDGETWTLKLPPS